jgi:hypothetical protein
MDIQKILVAVKDIIDVVIDVLKSDDSKSDNK